MSYGEERWQKFKFISTIGMNEPLSDGESCAEKR